jgi:hypothetical protein
VPTELHLGHPDWDQHFDSDPSWEGRLAYFREAPAIIGIVRVLELRAAPGVETEEDGCLPATTPASVRFQVLSAVRLNGSPCMAVGEEVRVAQTGYYPMWRLEQLGTQELASAICVVERRYRRQFHWAFRALCAVTPGALQ